MLPSTACIEPWYLLKRFQIGHAAVFVDDHGATAFATFVHSIRPAIVQPLVRPLAVVESEVSRQSGVQIAHRGIPVQIHVFVRDVMPQALNEDVVRSTASPVHADVNAFTFQDPGERNAGELAAPVSVEALGLAVINQCLLQAVHTKRCIHAVTDAPSQHSPKIPIDDRNQVRKAARQPDVRDVRTPDVVSLAMATPRSRYGYTLWPGC